MTRKDPLIVFVHIPKTAGSTVNAVLNAHFDRGMMHCEGIMDNIPELTRVSAEADWISGHVPFHLMRGRLQQVSDRPLRFFSIMRDPVSQVCSHYNWLIEIHRKGGRFYRNHPEYIRKLSGIIRNSDNSDPSVIIDNLNENTGLFLNMQASMLLGKNFDWNSGRLLAHLRKYEFIGTPRDLPELLTRMCGVTQEKPKRHNAALYHFDRSIFEGSRIRNFLMRNNFLDWMLFQTMQETRARAAVSAEFRRAKKRPIKRAVDHVPSLRALRDPKLLVLQRHSRIDRSLTAESNPGV